MEKREESRQSSPDKLKWLAKERVWTGLKARKNGVVDSRGGVERALAAAKERAKIAADSEVELVVYPPRKSFYEILTDQFNGGSSDSSAVSAWLSTHLSGGELAALRTIRGPLAMFQRGEPLALMPFTFLR